MINLRLRILMVTVGSELEYVYIRVKVSAWARRCVLTYSYLPKISKLFLSFFIYWTIKYYPINEIVMTVTDSSEQMLSS